MNPEIKRKWVEALRSGKYQQGRERLRTGNTYCCLGVLCDVAGEGTWKGYPSSIVYSYVFPDNVHKSGLLQDEFRAAVGMSGTDECHLTRMNDSFMASFSEIANYIEEKL